MLVRIWGEIHGPETKLKDLIESLPSRFPLTQKYCDYCFKQSLEPTRHYALAVILCKLAGEECQDLDFWLYEDKTPMGYKLKVSQAVFEQSGLAEYGYETEEPHIRLTSPEALWLHLENYHPDLYKILTHFVPPVRSKQSARQKYTQ